MFYFFKKIISINKFTINLTNRIGVIYIEENKSNNLIELIKNNCNQLLDILNEIINLKIKEIQFEKKICLDNMSEYKFELIKAKAFIENYKDIEMYFKIIKNSKIKESIFCYWCLIYEEELSNKNIELKEDVFLNKVLISELTKKKYYQSVFLTIENNHLNIIENGTEIDFIDINKYIKEKEKNNNLSEVKECFKGLEDYVLLIGIKMDRFNN